ncbi:MAG: hypothetical protein IJI57_04405 [Flexilinea sp.]|nr:hypothetical protein [Flexilinea sp.]
MKNNNVYKLYFDYSAIRLDSDGHITNENSCMYIAEYEWDDETETVGGFIRRVNGLYRHHNEELPMDISLSYMEEDLESLNDIFDTPEDAIEAIDEWLEDYKIWRTIRGGYYDPDEYVCEGLEDRDEIYYRTMAWCKIQKKRLEGVR